MVSVLATRKGEVQMFRIKQIAIVAIMAVLPLACYMQPSGMTEQQQQTVSATVPVSSRLSLYTYLAATKLEAGEISVEEAKQCQQREKSLRADLESAIHRNDTDAINDVSLLLGIYMRELEAKK